MWGFGKLGSALLAASYSPKTAQEIGGDFRGLYDLLGEKGAVVYKEINPTVKISYVAPPQQDGEDWSDDHILTANSHIMENDEDGGDSIFEKVAETHGTEKPIALYLPGLDGFGISAATWQFNDLSKNFELWRMTVAIEDRSSFGDLVKGAREFIEEITESTGRPVYLIGESFGGLLAPAVTINVQNRARRNGTNNPIEGLVLVNPATSFDESAWDVVAPVLTTLGYLTQNTPTPFGLPSPYSVIGGLTLSALIPSSEQFQRIVDLVTSLELNSPSSILETVQGALDMFKVTGEVLPPGLLEHRIKNWMIVGSDVVRPRLATIDVPTFMVIGNDDKLIGSKREVERLEKVLPKSQKLVVRGAGHFVLDQNVNLTEAIIFSDLYPLKKKESGSKKYDPILDWKLPPEEVIVEAMEKRIKPLEDAFSPIYISTDDNGKRAMGLDNLPKDSPPLLFVSNHQLLGLDLNILIAKLIENDIVVRGLAHPIVFQGSGSDELNGRTPGISPKTGDGNSATDTSSFRTFGAVMVTPRNYYRVLQSGQNALLFPGGVREVFHGRDEAYQLFWPEKVDFVRTAARFNATIIPLSAVGMADSLNILLEPSEIVDLPWIGERAKNFAANVTAARFDTTNENEVFLPPIVAPGLPSRNYFLFGKPMSTKDLDPSDKASCEDVYNELQTEMKRGFDDILQAREKDTYMQAPQRLAYERLTGQKAPTFDIEEVNRS